MLCTKVIGWLPPAGVACRAGADQREGGGGERIGAGAHVHQGRELPGPSRTQNGAPQSEIRHHLSTDQLWFGRDSAVLQDFQQCLCQLISLHATLNLHLQTAASARELEQYHSEVRVWLDLLEEEAKQGENLKEDDFQEDKVPVVHLEEHFSSLLCVHVKANICLCVELRGGCGARVVAERREPAKESSRSRQAGADKAETQSAQQQIQRCEGNKHY